MQCNHEKKCALPVITTIALWKLMHSHDIWLHRMLKRMSCHKAIVVITVQDIVTGVFMIAYIYYNHLASVRLYYIYIYIIESLKVWKKPKYNFLVNKCLSFL